MDQSFTVESISVMNERKNVGKVTVFPGTTVKTKQRRLRKNNCLTKVEKQTVRI